MSTRDPNISHSPASELSDSALSSPRGAPARREISRGGKSKKTKFLEKWTKKLSRYERKWRAFHRRLKKRAGGSWRSELKSRKILAAALILAGLLSLFYRPSGTTGWVAARTLPPGHTVEAGDFILQKIHPVPNQALEEDPTGRVTTQPFTKGQSAVEPGFLGVDFSELFPDFELVPIILSDPGNSTLLHAGDIVTVIARVGQESLVIASNVLVAVAAQPRLLIALPQEEAYNLAAASLNLPLTVVLSTTRENW
ncbi:MAG: SAF domain-containing protein [Corynebacterium sp.]|nr:SAF domain-containing protein [Corynebacterium sp.]